MPTVTIEEAQHRLTELIHGLACGEDLVITEHDQPIARLSLTAPPPQKPRTPGTLRSTVMYMAPDFDAPLDDFKEYSASTSGGRAARKRRLHPRPVRD
jgi:antitoxin (DNA-binding transcriptional repressor) of toxin-antitoxin stability system